MVSQIVQQNLSSYLSVFVEIWRLTFCGFTSRWKNFPLFYSVPSIQIPHPYRSIGRAIFFLHCLGKRKSWKGTDMELKRFFSGREWLFLISFHLLFPWFAFDHSNFAFLNQENPENQSIFKDILNRKHWCLCVDRSWELCKNIFLSPAKIIWKKSEAGNHPSYLSWPAIRKQCHITVNR